MWYVHSQQGKYGWRIEIQKKRKSIRAAAAIHGVRKSTLFLRVQGYKKEKYLMATNNTKDDSGKSNDGDVQIER